MNLLAKITVVNLLLALLAFSIGGVRVYRNFKDEVRRETDYTLKESYDEIVATMKTGVNPANLENKLAKITPLPPGSAVKTDFSFADTMALHPMLNRVEQLRRMTTIQEVGGQYYSFDIINVVIEQSDITRITQNILKDLFVLLGIILLAFNFVLFHWLLRPFKGTLEKIKSFQLQENRPLTFPETTTSEFRQLNNFLKGMLQKARNDYSALKEFSENASHEMQTPIAVATGKLELLLESPGLNDQQMELVQSAQEALRRLSKMGEALLLLTKIENLEFTSNTVVDFSALLNRELAVFAELAEMRGLKVIHQIKPGISLPIEPSLANIFIGNLLKNAIRHNIDQGWIEVYLDENQLVVKNSGNEPPMPPEQLFQRFQKSDRSGKSLGLGLAIVKKIAKVHGWEINYTYQEGIHQMRVKI